MARAVVGGAIVGRGAEDPAAPGRARIRNDRRHRARRSRVSRRTTRRRRSALLCTRARRGSARRRDRRAIEKHGLRSHAGSRRAATRRHRDASASLRRRRRAASAPARLCRDGRARQAENRRLPAADAAAPAAACDRCRSDAARGRTDVARRIRRCRAVSAGRPRRVRSRAGPGRRATGHFRRRSTSSVGSKRRSIR